MLLTVAYGGLVIGGICLVSLGGLMLVQRLVPVDSVAAGLHYCSHLRGLASRVEEAW